MSHPARTDAYGFRLRGGENSCATAIEQLRSRRRQATLATPA